MVHSNCDATNCLEVRKSTIPNGGLGLFAKKKFAKGEKIIEYIGEYKNYDTQNDSSEVHKGHTYCFEYKLGHCIDAADELVSSIARFANDSHSSGKKNNARFSVWFKNKDKTHVFLKAKHTIKVGDEILVSYGKSYWNTRDL